MRCRVSELGKTKQTKQMTDTVFSPDFLWFYVHSLSLRVKVLSLPNSAFLAAVQHDSSQSVLQPVDVELCPWYA